MKKRGFKLILLVVCKQNIVKMTYKWINVILNWNGKRVNCALGEQWKMCCLIFIRATSNLSNINAKIH